MKHKEQMEEKRMKDQEEIQKRIEAVEREAEEREGKEREADRERKRKRAAVQRKRGLRPLGRGSIPGALSNKAPCNPGISIPLRHVTSCLHMPLQFVVLDYRCSRLPFSQCALRCTVVVATCWPAVRFL